MNKLFSYFNRSTWPNILLILLATFLVYHNCFYNEMFWDDDDFILKNRYIKDWQFFPQFFSENLVAGCYLVSNYWRPVLLTVFATAWHAWGTWVVGWHSLNVGFHALDGVLIFFMFERLFKNRALSLGVALLFVMHPVHNEAVVYVNSLGDSLATFFVLSSLLLYVRFRQNQKPAWQSRNYYFSLLCYPMALMSKETGFVLLGLLPLLDFLLIQNSKSFWTRVGQTLKTTWPYFVLGLIYVILRGTTLNFSNSFNFYEEANPLTSSIFVRLMTFAKAMAHYAGFMFIPYELRVERQMPFALTLLDVQVLWGSALCLLMLYSIFRFWRSQPIISFGFSWFFIAIIPTSNILVPINAVLYEHFVYMPMIGIMLVAFYAGHKLIWRNGFRKISIGLLAIALSFFAYKNIQRNKDWHTAIGFYEQLVGYAPSYRVINNLGMEYADKGIHDKAEIWYNKAIAMDPNNPVGYHNIAGTYRDTGRIEQALAAFHKAIELDPRFIFSYRALADLYWRIKEYAKAKEFIDVLVRFDPQDKNAQGALVEINRILSKQTDN